MNDNNLFLQRHGEGWLCLYVPAFQLASDDGKAIYVTGSNPAEILTNAYREWNIDGYTDISPLTNLTVTY